jgi:methylated-DNA-[protein]-cysteine S-methyltransferase
MKKISCLEAQHFYKCVSTPVGRLTIVANEQSLIALLWEKDPFKRTQIDPGNLVRRHCILQQAEKQILEYFDRKRKTFDLPLQFDGTPFQKKVWAGLCNIPYGKTCSYLRLASQIGHAGAYRAVGTANGKNPLSIVVPCHRVIGSNGSLAGFAGGLRTKAFLLEHENRVHFF